MNKIKFNHPDLIALVSLIITFLFGYWGLQLSIASLNLSEKVSKQDQTIKDFNKLLNYTKTEIDTLSNLNKLLVNQVQILDKQLSISIQNQTQIDNQKVLTIQSEVNRLYITSRTIMMYLIDEKNYRTDSLTRWNNYNYLTKLIDKELNNNYLIKNKKIFDEWVIATEALKIQLTMEYAYSDKISEQQKYLTQKAGLDRILKLASNTIEYCFKFINKK